MNTWRKGIARWQVGDTLYLSVPFTWLLKEAETICADWEAKHDGHVKIGGPALMRPNTCDGFDPLMFHNPCATFTTRGCVNECKFCAVPKLEGDMKEIRDFRPAPVICDNNLLAASLKHIERVVDALEACDYPLVDFNQGLEARKFTPQIAEMFGRIQCKVRFALDHDNAAGVVKQAIDLCRRHTTKDIGIYCLIGFNDTPESARTRLELVRSWGIRPTPMRFQPLDAQVKNGYVAPNWTEHELRKTMHYYSRLRWFEHIPFADFEYNESEGAQVTLPMER